MRHGQFAQLCRTLRREPKEDLSPIFWIVLALNESSVLQAVGQFDGAVMLQQ